MLIKLSVNRNVELQTDAVYNLYLATYELAGSKAEIAREEVVVCDDYVGTGYSLPTEAMIETVQLLVRTEAILLDPIYTGKAMAGFIDLVRKGHFKDCKNVLFIYTGESPALYAYTDVTLRGL